MDTQALQACRTRFAQDDGALRALDSLAERGSLEHLAAAGYEALSGDLLLWLLRAESHAGSEVVYRSEDKVRGIPLGSFFDFPERYEPKMTAGAYLSAELDNGRSVVLYVSPCTRAALLGLLERAQQALPLSTDLPLRERIQEKLRAAGHLSCLSAEGLGLLDAHLVKYLDYAVNVNPGSELIYERSDGEVVAEALELALREPERFRDVPRPVFLAIEISGQSVVFDTQDISPANLWRLQKKARQVVEARKAEV